LQKRWKIVRVAAGVGIILAAAVLACAADRDGSSAAGQRVGGVGRAGASNIKATSATSAASASGTFGPTVGAATFDGVSPAVAQLPVLPVQDVPLKARDNDNLRPSSQQQNGQDPVRQKNHGTGQMPAASQNFMGICARTYSGNGCNAASNCGCLPPDTNGEVGLTQYVQSVNTSFAVFSKTGALLKGPIQINQLWSGAGGECLAHNDGDPVVLYDQLANRWLISQFIAQPTDSEDYGECIAVSQTGDATGAYNLYTFLFKPPPGQNRTFHDYPHLGVWPDGYYMSTNEFEDGQELSKGAGAFVFERDKMLAGQPARFVYFDESLRNPGPPPIQWIGQLPSDLDGSNAPPSGAPNYFAEVDDPSSVPPTSSGDTGFDLRLWAFHVDWSNPASSTFGNDGAPTYTLPVPLFVRPQCTYGFGPNCNPQKGGPEMADTLGDRLMFRLAYRNFGKYASIVLNHTVVADGRNGIRWYEVRFPNGQAQAPSIYQSGTYAPADPTTNPLWRWMGSAALDRRGDLAIGFSASGPNDYASIRYAGRVPADPLGELGQKEQTLVTGDWPQTNVEGRWGDYSDLTVDPADDCTFWYTTEYIGQTTTLGTGAVLGSWRTRIGSFRFPNCG
jgi:hypothetical protein